MSQDEIARLDTRIRRYEIALRRLRNLNNGPDQASASYRCIEAAEIASEALSNDLGHQAAQPDDDVILHCAFRYSLGRMTYIVNECCRWLRERWSSLAPNTRSMIKEELDEAIAHADSRDRARARGAADLGMEMDAKQWRELRAWMETN